MPSETFPFLADVPLQRTIMVVLGGASAWAELLAAVGMCLPVAGLGLVIAALLSVRQRALVLPVASLALALAAQLLAVARVVALPLYHSAITPGVLPPWVLDVLTRGLHTAFYVTLITGSVLVVGAVLTRTRIG